MATNTGSNTSEVESDEATVTAVTGAGKRVCLSVVPHLQTIDLQQLDVGTV